MNARLKLYLKPAINLDILQGKFILTFQCYNWKNTCLAKKNCNMRHCMLDIWKVNVWLWKADLNCEITAQNQASNWNHIMALNTQSFKDVTAVMKNDPTCFVVLSSDIWRCVIYISLYYCFLEYRSKTRNPLTRKVVTNELRYGCMRLWIHDILYYDMIRDGCFLWIYFIYNAGIIHRIIKLSWLNSICKGHQ